MAFDPDAYLAAKPEEFDPDAYLGKKKPPEQKPDWRTQLMAGPVGQAMGAAMQPIYGLNEMAYKGLGDVANLGGLYPNAVGNSLNDLGNAQAERAKLSDQAYQHAREVMGKGNFNPGKFAGLIASPANIVGAETNLPAAATALLGRGAPLANALFKGATYGSLTPTDPNSEQGFAEQKAKQAAIGTAVGGLGHGVGAAAKGGGKALAEALGVTTGAGGKSISEAYNAGLTGGQTADAFQAHLRGDAPITDVVSDAKMALSNIRAQRAAAYRSGMANVSQDNTVLSFKPVDEAMAKANDVNSFKGQDLSPNTTNVRQDVLAAINQWKLLPPGEFHTPEGFDALKQKLGDIKDAQPFNSPQRVIASNAYNAVRGAIVDQAPTYAKTMQDYSTGSNLIGDLEKTLSLGNKAQTDTAVRKLQSVLRDNVNTTYGRRAALAQVLAQNGAPDINAKIAGQTLSPMMARGLGRLLAGGEITGAGWEAAHGNLPMAAAMLPTLVAQSPRAVGEMAYYLGKGAKGAKTITSSPALAALLRKGTPSLAPAVVSALTQDTQ